MRVLLGNTGRGGEQCIFSAIVHAYCVHFSQAEITIAVCPEFVRLWQHDSRLSIIPLEHEDPAQPFYMNPYGKWLDVAKNFGEGIIEFACEYGLNPAATRGESHPAFENIWRRLKIQPCHIDCVSRKVFLTPSEEELRIAEDIRTTYGDDLLVISPKSNSAAPVIPLDWYNQIAKEFAKYHPVATTGRTWGMAVPDPLLEGTIDLRGKSLLSLYAMSTWLKAFIGPDTATPWVVSGMPGRMLVLRGDEAYPISNTGLVVNGFRYYTNTLEYTVNNLSLDAIINTCLAFLQY